MGKPDQCRFKLQ